MARLNEPAGESIESLKRRFVRQNRDLARVNSSQSIKIRALETEISRLLSENVLLRERNIQLETDLEDVWNRDIRGGVDIIKSKMDLKMQEIQTLLIDLANLNKKPRRIKSEMLLAQPKDTLLHPKGGSGANCSGGPPEGQLPTILEGKYFPRKTLEPQDVESVIAAERSDSSDIGPPPKTFLDSEETREEQAPRLDVLTGHGAEANLTEILLANFETRRRRRNSHLRQVAADIGNDENEGLLVPPVRIGSKRKFSVRDHKENEPEVTSSDASGILNAIREVKDAKSPRKEPPNLGGFNGQHKPNGQAKSLGIGPISSTSSPRKILGTKPVNTDPIVSPRKILKSDPSKDKHKDAKSSTDIGSRGVARSKPKSTIEVPVAIPNLVPSVTDIFVESFKYDPKTPAASMDVFSPDSAQASEPKAESDITARVTASEGPAGPGRGSRRTRAVVSYAEPNLVSKMRRPSKGLVDAVVADQGRKSGIISEDLSQASEGLPLDNSGTGIVHLQKDSTRDQEWKFLEHDKKKDLSRPEPPSPLRRKEATTSHPGISRPMLNKRRSRATSASSFSISETESSSLEKEFTNLDIFDVQDSPPQKDASSALRTKCQARRQTISNPNSSSSSSIQSSDRSRSTLGQRPISASQGVKQMRSVSSMSNSQVASHVNSAARPQGMERRKSMLL